MGKTAILFASFAAALCAARGETVKVAAGETVRPAREFADGVLVKEGAGTLDMSGSSLGCAKLVVREGTVRFSAGGGGAPKEVTTRHLRWTVTGTRPNAQFSGSGPQFSEFRLFHKGKPVRFPATTRSTSPHHADAEGADKGFDGNLRTKCYKPSPFVLDFGADVTFDAYSFATANDAPGRDPRDWVLEAGERRRGRIVWRVIGSERGFVAPDARFAEAGRLFQTAPGGSFPIDSAIEVCGKGRLVLDGLGGMLDNVSGSGLVELCGSSATFPAGSGFTGSVVGGTVRFEK